LSLYARAYSGMIKNVMSKMKTSLPPTVEGTGSRADAAEYCKNNGYQRVLIMTDSAIHKFGIPDKITEALTAKEIKWTIFEDILPNPTFSMVEAAKKKGLAFKAQCVIAVGGGSVMDCAKLTTAAMADPENDLLTLATPFKVKVQAVPLITVPTTAGTGAEVSMSALISDDKTHIKHNAASPKIMAVLAILDGETMANMPPKVTASTGFDALSHAVESYCSTADRKGEEHTYGTQAVRIIMEALPRAFHDPGEVSYRNQMSKAAFLAGMALNKEMAGYAHPFAHALGAVYNLPHGELIACTLPPVMRLNQEVCRDKFADLAVISGLGNNGENPEKLAERFISAVENMRKELNLPATLPQLKKEDYPALIKLIFKDAKNYPTPRFINKKQAIEILDKIRVG